MKMKNLVRFVVISSFVLFAYGVVAGQEKQTSNDTKPVAEKAKDAVVDGVDKAADATKSAAVKTGRSLKTFGSNAVEVTEGVVAKPIKKGRYYTVKTWDGTKWVSKQVWYETKKAAETVKKAVTQ